MSREEPVNVFARIRPNPPGVNYVPYELGPVKSSGVSQSIRIRSEDESVYQFAFNGIFDYHSGQEDVYNLTTEPVVESFLGGYNGCVFCYGQTATGKTFTSSGSTTYESRGLIPRAIQQIFQRVKNDPTSQVSVSFLEIYNDNGYDLLGTADYRIPIEQWPKVSLQEDGCGNLLLKSLSKHTVASEKITFDLYFEGNQRRIISSTPMNQASSRSHCIFTIELEIRNDDNSTVRTSRLHIVDLAGSERVWKTGLSDQVLSEAKHINRSLHYLEHVIHALRKRRSSKSSEAPTPVSSISSLSGRVPHIPFRNSLLTLVLKDSLGGNSRTVMIATISMQEESIGETIATARFAQRCSQVNTCVKVNEVVDYQRLSEKLMQENKALAHQLGGPFKEGLIEKLEDGRYPSTDFQMTQVHQELDEFPKSIRELLNETNMNLTKLPREYRKALLRRVLDEGLDTEVKSIGELCAIVQVLLAKLDQTVSQFVH